jgi:hypothetical protein
VSGPDEAVRGRREFDQREMTQENIIPVRNYILFCFFVFFLCKSAIQDEARSSSSGFAMLAGTDCMAATIGRVSNMLPSPDFARAA